MEALHTDVCIIGAGPGGSAAALQLGKHGVKTILLDKASFPRDKVCGDALSGKVVRELERLAPELVGALRSKEEIEPSWGVIFVSPGGKVLKVPFSQHTGEGDAPGGILPRMHFDHFLLQAVKQANQATVLEGHNAKAFERTATGWTITAKRRGADDLLIHARLLIDASGGNSVFATQVAGIPMEPQHHSAGVRTYYRGVKNLDP